MEINHLDLKNEIMGLKKDKITGNAHYDSINLNDILVTEVGDFNAYCTNIPWTTGSGGMLFTYVVDTTNYGCQIAINLATNEIYKRIRVSSEWQEWHLIPSTTVVTGTLSSGSATISYPTGMNKDNCIPISVNFGNASETQWACGALFDSSSYVGGVIPYKLLMREDNISLTLKNINLTNGDAPYVNNANVNLPYRVVLMKI